MPGKLPIDRVREMFNAPRIFEQIRRQFGEKQARLDRQQASGQNSPDIAPPGGTNVEEPNVGGPLEPLQPTEDTDTRNPT